MTYPFGLNGPGMHNYIIDGIELGKRAATFLDNETAFPWSWWVDIVLESEMI